LTESGAALLTAAEAEVRRMEQQLSAVLGSSEAPLLRALDRLDRLDSRP
ncbi:MarR family transcriptional regulator, partial [Xanthomonas oryzae pv. oryzae]